MFEPLASDIACGSIHDHEFYRLRKILVSAARTCNHSKHVRGEEFSDNFVHQQLTDFKRKPLTLTSQHFSHPDKNLRNISTDKSFQCAVSILTS